MAAAQHQRPSEEPTSVLEQRLRELDWAAAAAALDERGYATFAQLLSPQVCSSLTELYGKSALFRSTVVMERHGFGRGEYKYFDYPLPDVVRVLRPALYRELAPIGNRWNE